MKKILTVVAISSIFLSCKNKSTTDLSIDKNVVLTDTALLNRSGIYSDTAANAEVITNADGTITTTKSTTTVITTTTSSNNLPKKAISTNTGSITKAPSAKTTTGNTGSGTTTAPTKRDKGWSSAAKGTAIGAGSGAVLGAVVSKKKAQGAVVGGIIGAAGGYVIGRDMDKKSGRVARSKQ